MRKFTTIAGLVLALAACSAESSDHTSISTNKEGQELAPVQGGSTQFTEVENDVCEGYNEDDSVSWRNGDCITDAERKRFEGARKATKEEKGF